MVPQAGTSLGAPGHHYKDEQWRAGILTAECV